LLALTAWEILLVSKANAFFFLKRIVEILGNADARWQRLLNALQTPGGPLMRRSDEFCSRTPEPVPSAVRWLGHHAEGTASHASRKITI
jgi:hypothetical protein